MNIAKGSITILFASSFSTIAEMLIARILGPEQKGIYDPIRAYTLLFFTLGYLSLNVSFLSLFKKRKYTIGEFSGTALFYGLFIGGFLYLLFLASFFFSHGSFYKNLPFNYLALNFTLLPLILLMTFFSSILQASGNIYGYNLTRYSLQAFKLLFVILFLVIFKFSVAGVICAFILGYIASVLVSSFYINKECPLREWSVNTDLLKNSLRDSLKLHIGSIAVFIFTKINIIMLNHMSTKTETGYYSTMVALATGLFLIPQAIQAILYPRTGKDETDKQMEDIIVKVSRHAFYITLIAGIILAILSKYAVMLYGGSSYLPGLSSLLILLPGVILQSITVVLSVLWVRKGLFSLLSVVAILNACLNVVLNLILIPKMGINGAAIATTITYSFNLIMHFIMCKKYTDKKISELFIIKRDDVFYYKRLALRALNK